jgi:hypothetical protein
VNISGANQTDGEKEYFKGISPELALSVVILSSFTAGVLVVNGIRWLSDLWWLRAFLVAAGCFLLCSAIFSGLRLIKKLTGDVDRRASHRDSTSL